jgi:hypothetical protein
MNIYVIPPMQTTCPAHRTLLVLTIQIIFGVEERSLLCNFLQLPATCNDNYNEDGGYGDSTDEDAK